MNAPNKINSALFTWPKYITKVGFASYQVWDCSTNRPKPGFTEVGRCPASSLVIRPRTEGEGVMLRDEESGDEFWLHAVSDEAMGIYPRT